MKILSPDELQTLNEELSVLSEETQSTVEGVIAAQSFIRELVEEIAQSSGHARTKSLKELFKVLQVEQKKPEKDADAPCDSEEKGETEKSQKEDLEGGNNPPKDKDDGEESKEHPQRSNDDYNPTCSHLHQHPDLQPGDTCPECDRGKVYPFREKIIPIIIGRAPLAYEEHRIQQLRCNACGVLFEPKLPKEIPKIGKAMPSAQVVLSLLHYEMGIPFERLSFLQGEYYQGMSPSQLWEIMQESANILKPIFMELEREAAQGELFYTDDTGVNILSLHAQNEENRKKKKKNGPEDRVAMYSSVIISSNSDREIHLYFHGRKYAGENLSDLLQHRIEGLATPIQMKDALSQNDPRGIEIKEAKCNSHALRKFKELPDVYSKECFKILELYRSVYKNEEYTQELSAEERFAYHKKHSLPLMEQIKVDVQELLDQRKVEPNSSFGGAISYFLSHYNELIAFCLYLGAPLDNNKAERSLKMIIRLRKNSMFYKTENGASVASILQSLIYTAKACGVNAQEYLQMIFKNPKEVASNPERFLPWNYQEGLLEGDSKAFASI